VGGRENFRGNVRKGCGDSFPIRMGNRSLKGGIEPPSLSWEGVGPGAGGRREDEDARGVVVEATPLGEAFLAPWTRKLRPVRMC